MDLGASPRKETGSSGREERRTGHRGWLFGQRPSARANPDDFTWHVGPLVAALSWLILTGAPKCAGCLGPKEKRVRSREREVICSYYPSRCREAGDLRRLELAPVPAAERQSQASVQTIELRSQHGLGTCHPASPSCWCPGLFKALPSSKWDL